MPERAQARPAPARRGRWTRRRGGRPSAARRPARRGSTSRFESSTRSGWVSTLAASSGARSPVRPRSQACRTRGVGGPVGRRAHEVEDEPPLPEPERGQVRVAEGDDLDVDVGIRRADALDAHLVVLAQATGLGLLVAEGRRGVPDLPRHRRAVLDVGTGDRRRALGAEGHVAAALVLEVVHLLGDDVGALADALEHADVLEHRRLDQPVAEPPGEARERGQQRLPASRLGRQHVLGALGGTEVRTVGHGGRGYRSPPTAPKSELRR